MQARERIRKRVIHKVPAREKHAGSRKGIGEKNGFALDDSNNPGDSVAFGNGQLLHAGRVRTYSAGAGDRGGVDPSDPRATASLRKRKSVRSKGLGKHASEKRCFCGQP
jgi:hypothetical protein